LTTTCSISTASDELRDACNGDVRMEPGKRALSHGRQERAKSAITANTTASNSPAAPGATQTRWAI
jgi:hypothetical protein